MDSRIKTFISQALPQNGEKHVLAIGEFHNATGHQHFIRENLDALKNEHNVQAMGVELSAVMNVILSAYKDGNLPVEKGKERAYVTTLMQAYSNRTYPLQAAERAHTLMDAIDKGIQVVGVDGRELSDEQAKKGATALSVLARHPEVSQTLRTSADLETLKKALVPVVEDFKTTYAKGRKFTVEETAALTSETAFYVMMSEVRQLCQTHPQYMQQLVSADKEIVRLRKEGKHDDEISAALFANAVKKNPGNAILDFGNTHLNGHTWPQGRTNGQLGELIRNEGFNVTSVSVIGQDEFRSVLEPAEAATRSFPFPAVSAHPMHLLVVGSAEKPDVLIQNLQNGVSTQDAGGSEIGSYVASHLHMFAATPQMIEADKLRVIAEAKSYLTRAMLPAIPADSPNPMVSELHDNIVQATANKDATAEQMITLVNTTARLFGKHGNKLPQTIRALAILRELSEMLGNYASPDAQMWQQEINAQAHGAGAVQSRRNVSEGGRSAS